MNKKILFTAVALFGMAFNANAQFAIGKPAGDIIIEKALTGSIVIVEQKYQLKEVKTGDLYGRGGNDEFGTVYGIGIMTKNGLIASDEIAHPWNHDNDYIQYSENKKYAPVLFTTSIKASGQTDFIEIETDKENLKEVDDQFFVFSQANKKMGIAISDTTGIVDGWMVWATIPSESDLDATTELKQMIIYKKQFELKDKESKIDSPQSLDKVKIGFFTVPCLTETGTITFEICGVSYKKDTEWMYIPVTNLWEINGNNNSATVDPKENKEKDKIKGGKSEELTPSGKNEKQKKGK